MSLLYIFDRMTRWLDFSWLVSKPPRKYEQIPKYDMPPPYNTLPPYNTPPPYNSSFN